MTISPLPVEGALSVVAADRARSGWTLQGWEPEANREEGSRRGGAAVKGYPAIPGDLLPPEPRTQTLDSESSQGLLPARSSGPRLTGSMLDTAGEAEPAAETRRQKESTE